MGDNGAMPLDSFYTTAGQLFFTLLGFWWVVVQFKHDKWAANSARRRMAYVVSLHFLLPGLMCIVSLIAANVQYMWNLAFALAGVLGIASSLLVATSSKGGGNTALLGAGQYVAAALYMVIVLLAIFPSLAPNLIGLRPLEMEGIMLALLAFLGVNIAWFLFMEPAK